MVSRLPWLVKRVLLTGRTGYLESGGVLCISYLQMTEMCTTSKEENCRLDTHDTAMILLACSARREMEDQCGWGVM